MASVWPAAWPALHQRLCCPAHSVSAWDCSASSGLDCHHNHREDSGLHVFCRTDFCSSVSGPDCTAGSEDILVCRDLQDLVFSTPGLIWLDYRVDFCFSWSSGSHPSYRLDCSLISVWGWLLFLSCRDLQASLVFFDQEFWVFLDKEISFCQEEGIYPGLEILSSPWIFSGLRETWPSGQTSSDHVEIY